MLPKRVKILLDSKDIDLVRIGVSMMKHLSAKEDWHRILEAFQHDDVPYDLWIKKWEFKIEGDEITITPNHLIDLWAMKQKIDAPLLSLSMFNNTNGIKIDGEKFKFELPCVKE